MLKPTDQIKALRLLRYAKAATPATLTKDRRDVLNVMLHAGLVEKVGEGPRGRGILLKLTKVGETELRVLEQTVGDRLGEDHAVKQAARRVRGR